MNWIVIDTVIQPSSGISFSAVWCKIKLIIWYQSDIFLPPGCIFTPVHSGIILNNKELSMTIYNVIPFNKKIWDLIKNSKDCPAESPPRNKCFNERCILKICPYGLKWHPYNINMSNIHRDVMVLPAKRHLNRSQFGSRNRGSDGFNFCIVPEISYWRVIHARHRRCMQIRCLTMVDLFCCSRVRSRSTDSGIGGRWWSSAPENDDQSAQVLLHCQPVWLLVWLNPCRQASNSRLQIMARGADTWRQMSSIRRCQRQENESSLHWMWLQHWAFSAGDQTGQGGWDFGPVH